MSVTRWPNIWFRCCQDLQGKAREEAREHCAVVDVLDEEVELLLRGHLDLRVPVEVVVKTCGGAFHCPDDQ